MFYVAMVSVAAGFSVRNLPSMAVEGWPLVSWYVLGTLLFLLPLALTAAELASAWPQDGGVFAWVREAFGERTGFMAVWSIVACVPSINDAYWILTATVTALLGLYYLPIFAAVIRLRYTQAHTVRPFRIPGGMIGVWLVGGAGFLSTAFADAIALGRPSNVTVVPDVVYVILMLALASVWMAPWVIFVAIRKSWWREARDERLVPESSA